MEKIFSKSDFVITEDEVKFSTDGISIRKVCFKFRHFKSGWSKLIEKFLISPLDAVGILLYDPVEEKVVLIEQFRLGALNETDSPWTLEIIAGAIDSSIDKEKIIRKEAIEEANYQIIKLLPITNYLLSPGISSQKMYLYCGIIEIALDKRICENPEEHEDILVHSIDFNNALELLRTNKINNAATIVALQWLQLNKTELLSLKRNDSYLAKNKKSQG